MSISNNVRPGTKIVPFLWYVDNAEEAARFYASVFPDSRVTSVAKLPPDPPSERSVTVVEFRLAGHWFVAMSAGKFEPFNHAISLNVNCEDQAEIDRLWKALSDGGKPEECGWVRDRYGVSWQIVPASLGEMMKDPDRNRVKRVRAALLKMKKIDIAALERAYKDARAPVDA